MAFLKVFSRGEERTVFLGSEPILVGRGEDADILLQDVKASRLHCVIEPCGGERWRVRDLDSANGTKLNGEKIGTEILQPDDVVKVGDARILFAGEAVSVVRTPEEPAGTDEPERPRRRRRKSALPFIAAGAAVLVAFAALLIFSNGADDGRPRYGAAEARAYEAVRAATTDAEQVELAETYLRQYPRSRNEAEVTRMAAAARERLRQGTSARARGYDFETELRDLTTLAALEKLKAKLEGAKKEHRPALEDLVAQYRQRLDDERSALFADLRESFDRHVEEGQYARAREIWFFLRGDPRFEPFPPKYVNRIVQANSDLEASAAGDRTRLFEEVAVAEQAHDFAKARELLLRAAPRFQGTSVERSLRERLAFVDRALKGGVEGRPTPVPAAVVRVDVSKKMKAALARLGERDFRGAATALRALATEVEKEQSFPQVDARARECEAAVKLQEAVEAALAAGKLPKGRLARKWRVTAGGADGVAVKTKDAELTYTWREAPSALYVALLAAHAEKSPLGYCVLVHAVGSASDFAEALAFSLEKAREKSDLHAFVAARVKSEDVPEGGYVVHAGEIISKKEYLRRQEEAVIQRFTQQFERSFAAIMADTSIRKLDKLRTKKDELDKARAFAKELIYDEKKYFYPYRGTGRMGEYQKVQQEVDRRVAAVRELWDKVQPRTVKSSKEVQRALVKFDEAAAELEKRLVYVEDKVEEVAFLRAYFGRKFTIRNFFRTAEERELLDYGAEVMEFNTKVKGDITEVEREQVRVTNEYRLMFGHQPVRLVEPLVKSSRGHCEEMSRLGYFGHFSPTEGRRTPYDRMKLEGYKYGASENCIMGQTSPEGAHNGWCHSSGHHRNLLMPAWTEMGTGHYGRYMTQNFGAAPKWREKDKQAREKDEDAEWDGGEQPKKDGDGDFDYDDDEDDGEG